MAFAPMGPEASFFRVLDQHRLALIESLKEGPGEVPRKEASSSEVLASIENIIQDIVTSLARNEAPFLTLDNRSNWENIKFEDSVGLQMIPHCTTKKIKSDSAQSAQRFALILKILSMIYKLVQSNTYATKRDIYYTDIQLFGNQSVVDNIINDISCMLKVPRRNLHILSTSKGLIAGNLSYIEEDGTKVNCTYGSTVLSMFFWSLRFQTKNWKRKIRLVASILSLQFVLAVAVPSNIQGIRNLATDAKFLLIVEKDATFQRLLDDNFCNRLSPCIIITGKGVPDLNTRLLVKKLWDTFHLPIFTLVDADPHGIEIMCIYKYGSLSMSFEAHNLTVPTIRWLGLLPSDIERLNIPRGTLIPLTNRDQMKLDSILKRPYVTCQPFWKKEMEIMAHLKMKAEIQALTFISSDYLSRVYLPNKLQFGGWI